MQLSDKMPVFAIVSQHPLPEVICFLLLTLTVKRGPDRDFTVSKRVKITDHRSMAFLYSVFLFIYLLYEFSINEVIYPLKWWMKN